MTPAKIYPFSIPAGGSFPLLVIGDYAKILTSSGPLELAGDTFGSIGPILAGQGVQDSPFSRLVLVDKSGDTNNGTILIADNAFIDDRITGTVEVIDGQKNKTENLTACFGYYRQPPLAANYTNMQLWNPAGSQRNVFLNTLGIFLSPGNTSAGGIGLYEYNTPLVFSRNVKRKKLSGGNGIAELRGSNSAALLVAGIDIQATFNSSKRTQKFENPIMLPPGVGLLITNITQNEDLGIEVEITEEAIL